MFPENLPQDLTIINDFDYCYLRIEVEVFEGEEQVWLRENEMRRPRR